MRQFWLLHRNPTARAWIIQVLAVIAVAWFAYAIASNTAANLAQQGIASGFGFLQSEAGFDVSMHLIDYDESSSYGRAFAVAVLNTLLVSALGVFLATILGFVIGVARLSPNYLVSRLASVYIEIIRNVPLLLQLFFWYFAVLRTLPGPRASLSLFDTVFLNIRGLYLPGPEQSLPVYFILAGCLAALVTTLLLRSYGHKRFAATGQRLPVGWLSLAAFLVLPGLTYMVCPTPISLSVPALKGFNFQGGLVFIPELVALLTALTIYTAAFIAEIVRAGILGVDRGQTEAALALGLTRGQNLRLVVIPQAMRIIVPPLTSQFLNLTKNSSLAAAIAYPDLVLVFAGTVLMQTGQAVEVVLLTMGVYLVVSLSISVAMNVFNSRFALVER